MLAVLAACYGLIYLYLYRTRQVNIAEMKWTEIRVVLKSSVAGFKSRIANWRAMRAQQKLDLNSDITPGEAISTDVSMDSDRVSQERKDEFSLKSNSIETFEETEGVEKQAQNLDDTFEI